MTMNDDVQRWIALLRDWLASRLAADQLAWIDEQTARIAAAPAGNSLTIAVGLRLAPHRQKRVGLNRRRSRGGAGSSSRT